MSGNPDRKERLALLKRVRAARGELVRAAREERRRIRAVRRKVERALAGEPKTVPAVAAATGVSTDEVLWHVIAMKKYGRVAEEGEEGDWCLYRLLGEREEEP